MIHENEYYPTRNYTLEMRCETCAAGPNRRPPPPPPKAEDQAPIASIWLLLVLLSATLLLCTVSICFCFRVYCLRMAARRARAAAAHAAALAPSGPMVLAALEPYLEEVLLDADGETAKGKGKEKGGGESDCEGKGGAGEAGGGARCEECDEGEEPGEMEPCAICLGELCAPPAEPPNAATGDTGSILKLPCQHVFHGPCIRGWILHRGMAASCPLCKRAIGPPPPSQPPPGLLGSPATVVPEADADAPPPPPPPTRAAHHRPRPLTTALHLAATTSSQVGRHSIALA